MKVAFLLVLVLCVPGTSRARASCPHVCSCTAGVVDCSERDLTTATLPTSFPASTSELRLHDNYLTALPTGLLDQLPGLRHLTLHGNPWECNCAVLYLRGWLLKQPDELLIR